MDLAVTEERSAEREKRFLHSKRSVLLTRLQ
jgi:hypothetical protein